MSIERDPRTNPQFGDRVTVADETREVERVDIARGVVIYSWPGKLAVRTLRLSAWQAWAADATAWQSHAAAQAA